MRKPSIAIYLNAWRLLVCLLCSWLFLGQVALASTDPFQGGAGVVDPYSEVEFFKVESDIVTSVSRHAESLWGASAAIFVVRGDEIRDSGAQTLTDVLRIVPGLAALSVDANFSAISARGFNSVFAEKMLVLLDGRPIYNPIFGGTIWHEWNTFLPDVDRIEVIRGPGGTLYGSNAVNGVINIISRSSTDTRSTLARAFAGTNGLGQTEIRFGTGSKSFSYRVYGRYGSDEGFGGDGGDKIRDERQDARFGYRFDWSAGRGLVFLGSGEFLDARLGNNVITSDGSPPISSDKFESSLASSVWRLEKDFSNGSRGYLQFSQDYVDRDAPVFAGLETTRRSYELELQHSFRLHPAHRITWGTNARTSDVDTVNSLVTFRRNDVWLNLVGGFLQDEIDLGPRTRLTLGTKVENNTFTGTNFQPSGRISHRLDHDRTLWAAVSRAINSPSVGDVHITIPLSSLPSTIPGMTIQPVLASDGAVRDTKLLAYEAGYRHRFNDRLSVDLAAFYNEYDDVADWTGNKSLPPVPDPNDPTKLIVVTFLDNESDGYGYGAEANIDFKVSARWRGQLNGGYIHQRITGNLAPGFPFTNLSTPEWSFNLRQTFQISRKLKIVPTLYWTDGFVNLIRAGTDPEFHVGSNLRADLAIHYQHNESWPTISLVGQNINDRSHVEFVEEAVRPPSSITRTWFIRVSKEF
ncbi:MAG: TonB-dependent receptor plug domain-containing protein [Candidatus Binatia bacterium]